MVTRRQVLATTGSIYVGGVAGCVTADSPPKGRQTRTRRVTNGDQPAYEVLTVGADETKRLSVRPERPLENLLVDITAPGADVRIRTSGDGWLIRNVGVAGKFQDHFSTIIEGSGRLQSVYFGDGTENGVTGGGVWHNHAEISGPIIYDRFHIAQTTNNGVYGAPTADAQSGKPVHYRNCYFDSCQNSQLKVGSTEPSTMTNCVVRTDGDVPTNADGFGNTRGIWALQDKNPDGSVNVTRTRVVNCDIKGSISHMGKGLVVLENTRWDGSTVYPDRVIGDSRGKPDLTPPAGCPMTPEAAASG